MVDITPDEKQEKQELDAIFKSEPKRYNPVEFEEDEEDEAPVRTHPWENQIVRIVAAVIIIVLIIIGARWLHHELKSNNTVSTKPTTATHTTQPSTSIKTGASPTNSNPSSGSAASKTSSTPTNIGAQVPNTGPGSTLAIFLGASFAAGALHFTLSKRRA